MKNLYLLILLPLFFIFNLTRSFSQTSWTGVTSVNWASTTNWTNGVPSATTDVIIGDANFIGAFQPAISASSTAKTLTIGGAVSSQLTVTSTFTVRGDIIINSNGGIINGSASLSLTGDWINEGIYSTTSNNATVIFAGINQSISGSVQTIFRKLTINSGSIVTLQSDFTCTGAASVLIVSGTLNPNEPGTHLVTADSMIVNSSGVLKVSASAFNSNYQVSKPVVLNSGSIVEYSSKLINQTVSNDFTYSTLRISGEGTVKTLPGNLPPLRSTSSTAGYIYLLSGTLDLGNYTANRGTTVAGGVLSVSNGAILKIGGTNGFPTGFTTNTLPLSSTVEYNGGNQDISGRTYGNLILSGSAGAAIKTMPATAFTVAGSLTTDVGSGTSLSITAASNITITGSLNIGASTTFDGGTFTHSLTGNWVSNGIFIPGNSTISMRGANTTIGGSPIQTFNNLSISGSNISAPSITSINISGNLVTTGSGSFNQPSGTLAMNGSAKAITGISITLNNLNVAGVITSTTTATITGNINVTGSLTTTSGTLTMNGTGKTITNSGTLIIRALKTTGTITTSSNFSISSSLINTGSFNASSGTLTFTGSTTLTGAVAVNNITITGSYLRLAANSVLGITNTLTTTGSAYLNATSYVPNTVNYNGAAAQMIKNTSYNNLILSNGNVKTAQGAITVNNVLTIAPATTFDAGTFAHTINGNWINNGNFTAGSSNIQFRGATNTTITGASRFNILTIRKSAASNSVTLLENVETSTAVMTTGTLKTGSKILTITNTRSGNGIILGTITRAHAFAAGISYAFEGPYTTIRFTTVSAVNSITLNTTLGNVPDFPNGGSISRTYKITIPSGTYTSATLRLHYEDAELNGNDETKMQLWRHNGTTWTVSGKTTANASTNYVEKTGLSDITNRWSFTDDGSVLAWNGSVSSDWSTSGNWSLVQGVFSGAPGATDIVQIGKISFTNQPVISSVIKVKGITFGSTQNALLTLATGAALTVDGTIQGTWGANATHTIQANNFPITVNGDLILSDGISGHAINVDMGWGILIVNSSIVQSGNANVSFSGSGSLRIGQDYEYFNGTFTPGTGTVIYNGTGSQSVAAIPYHHLTISKTAGSSATISDPTTLTGNLSVTSGELDIYDTVAISGSVNITGTAIVEADSSYLLIGGNFTQAVNATFNAGSGTVVMNGAGTQTISARSFNILAIDKPIGTVNLNGDITVSKDLSLLAGIFNLSTYSVNQSVEGDVFLMADGTTLNVSGAHNFPANFTNYDLDNNSTVHYDGMVAQTAADITYGNLIFSNGGLLEKEFLGAPIANGDIVINNGALVKGKSAAITLNGNWINNNGMFIPESSSLLLNGIDKTITGSTIFNDVSVNGSYSVASSDITFKGDFFITNTGSYDAGSGVATVNGDFINSGYAFSSGTTTFTGTRLQTIRLVNALLSTSTGIVNFDGSVSPDFNSTTTPTFATLNINNTAGINPSVDWLVLVAFNVNHGAAFHGNGSTHTIKGSFSNDGTVTSNGTLYFNPYSAVNLKLNGTNFTSLGEVIFGGTGQTTITGIPTHLENVVIANTNASGITAPSAWVMNGDFSIHSNSIFNAGSFSHLVAGNIEIDGILDGNTSTITMSSISGQLTGSPGTIFNNLTITGNITANSDFNVAGDFTNNGSYDGARGALIMTGKNNSFIKGTTFPSSIAQLTINKDPGIMVTANVDINAVSSLIVNSGVFFTSTNTISQDGEGGALVVMGGATLKIGGTNTLPAFSGYGLDVESTVDYAGTVQTIAQAGSGYGNVIISTAGNKIAASFVPLTIAGDFTITAGNFVANNNTHKLAGNWVMTGGAFTNTNSVIQFNGIETQTIQTIAPFNNIAINKSGGSVLLGSDIIVNNITTFTKGNIKTGTYKVIIPSTGSVVGAGQSKGWINGNLQKNVALGTLISRSFEIGDSTYYTPSTILFSSVAAAGNIIAKVTPTDHTEGDYSGIDTTRSVNKYWSIINDGVGFSNANMTLNWVPSDVDAGAIFSNFKTAAFNGSNWLLNSTASPMSGSIQATGVTAFGDFQIGEAMGQFTWTGNAMTSDWHTRGNWSGGVPTARLNTLIPSGIPGGKVYPILNSGTGTVNNLIIENTASLTVDNAKLQVAGAVTNSGILDAANGTIEWNGFIAQTISANTFKNNALNHLIINNSSSSGVSLGGQLDIYGSLTYKGTGRVFHTNDTLTLKSNAANTAWVGDLTGNSITGKVTVERYNSQHKAWRLLSIPTNTTQTIKEAWQEGGTSNTDNPVPGYGVQLTGPGGLSAGFDLYTATPSIKTFNPLTNNWDAIANTNLLKLNSPGGYLVFVRGNRLSNAFNSPVTETILRTKGPLYTGMIGPISVEPEKFTSIGNPYASPIDFSKVTRTNGVDEKFYVWDPFLPGYYNLGGYQTMSATNNWEPVPGGTTAYPTGVPCTTIQSGQAFLVHATLVNALLPANYEVYFNEDNKVNGNGIRAFNRPQGTAGRNSRRQFFRASLYTGSSSTSVIADGNVVAFDENFSSNIDGNDALKIAAAGENFDVKRNNKLLSIEGRNRITESDTIYYSISRLAAKTYQLRFAPVNMGSEGMEAYLIDNYLNSSTPVSLTDSSFINITVTSDAKSGGADRFKVVFKKMAVLPVTFTSISAAKKGKDIIVQWKVENESGIQQYEVEKSEDGIQFTKAATYAANNSGSGNYSWLDEKAGSGYSYYRVRSVGQDAQVQYTQIVKVLIGKFEASMAVYPNPIVNGSIQIQFNNQPAGVYRIKLLNSLGQVILSKEINHTEGNSIKVIHPEQKLAKGVYQLEVVKPGGIVEVMKVVN